MVPKTFSQACPLAADIYFIDDCVVARADVATSSFSKDPICADLTHRPSRLFKIGPALGWSEVPNTSPSANSSCGHIVFALIAIVIVSYPACAYSADGTADSGSSMFSFNGFGTLGVVHSSDNQSDFVSKPAQPKGAGYTDSWSATPDTKLGIQLNVAVTDRLSAVVQVMSQYQYDGTFKPDLEWGNVKYQVTPDLSVRAGRIAIPTFMVSDSLNIGYALPFARIPLEVYGQLPETHSDGIDGSYRMHVGDAINTVQVFLGDFKSKLPNQGTYNTHDLYGIVDTIEFGAATLHFSYQTLRYELSFEGLVLDENPQRIITIGAGYDPGKWYVSGEVIRVPDDAFGLFYGGYINAGRRFGKVTPYLGYARIHMSRAGSLGLPPFINQDTSTLGVRWDFMKHVDFKAQLDHTRRFGGFNQYFLNQQPGFQQSGTVEIFTLLVDFVF
jgi:hypothetical protein